MATASVELRSVSKTYGTFRAVDRLDLAIPAGSIFGFLGPNGAGKTTSIRMIMDIIAPDRGEVLFAGRRRSVSDLERVGYLPEERGLYRKMTVHEHLVFLGRLRGMRRADAGRAAQDWLERVELGAWAAKKVEELSKGMQQKIQLAGTVLHEPELLILDEPFSGLDPINQGLFKELLAEYRKGGRTVVFSTHIMEQAEKLCDQICLISGGREILGGSLAEIKDRHGSRTFRLTADGDLTSLSEVPGVESCHLTEGGAQLRLAPDARSSDVLRRLIARVDVHEFVSVEPSLEEIFITAVRDAS